MRRLRNEKEGLDKMNQASQRVKIMDNRKNNIQSTSVVRPTNITEIQQWKPEGIPWNLTGIMLRSPHIQLQFTNFDEAEEAMTSREISHDWRGPGNDSTLPSDETSREYYVNELIDAFVNSTPDNDNRQQSLSPLYPNLGQIHPPPQSELVAFFCVSHQLVNIAYRLHTEGPRSTPIVDPAKLAQIYRTSRKLTFMQRIDSLCALIRRNPTRRKTLLAQENLYIAAACPVHLLRQSERDKPQNDRRQGLLQLARAEQREEDRKDGDRVW